MSQTYIIISYIFLLSVFFSFLRACVCVCMVYMRKLVVNYARAHTHIIYAFAVSFSLACIGNSLGTGNNLGEWISRKMLSPLFLFLSLSLSLGFYITYIVKVRTCSILYSLFFLFFLFCFFFFIPMYRYSIIVTTQRLA